MRSLDLEATIRAVQILDTLGKMEDIKKIINDNDGNIDGRIIVNTGIDLISGLCRKDVVEDTVALLAYVFEKTPEEARKTSLIEYKKLFSELAERNDLKVFWKMCVS